LFFGADYQCKDGSKGVTDINGTFKCQELPATFKIGELELGSIKEIAKDGYVVMQDLAGVDRNDTNNTKVLEIAQLLQSIDDDNNPSNGIHIRDEIKEKFKIKEKISQNLIARLKDKNIIIVDKQKVREHIENVLDVLREAKESNNSKELVYHMLGSSKNLLDSATKSFIQKALIIKKANIKLLKSLIEYYKDNENKSFIETLKKLYKVTVNDRFVNMIAKKYNIKPTIDMQVDIDYSNYLENSKTSVETALYILANIETNYIDTIKEQQKHIRI